MPAEVHHRRSGTGGGAKASDFDTMPLCYPHHRDHPGAFHVLGTKAFAKYYGVTEAELIKDTRQRLGFDEEQISEWKESEKKPKRKAKSSLTKTPSPSVKTSKKKQICDDEKLDKPKSRTIQSASSLTKKTDVKYKWASRKLVSAGTIKSRPFPKQASSFKSR
jgi:hypothetical protein